MIAIRNYYYYEVRDGFKIELRIKEGDEFEEGEYSGDGYLDSFIMNYLTTEGILVNNGD